MLRARRCSACKAVTSVMQTMAQLSNVTVASPHPVTGKPGDCSLALGEYLTLLKSHVPHLLETLLVSFRMLSSSPVKQTPIRFSLQLFSRIRHIWLPVNSNTPLRQHKVVRALASSLRQNPSCRTFIYMVLQPSWLVMYACVSTC